MFGVCVCFVLICCVVLLTHLHSGSNWLAESVPTRCVRVRVRVSSWVGSASHIQIRFTYIYEQSEKKKPTSKFSAHICFELIQWVREHWHILVASFLFHCANPWVCRAENSDPCIVTHAKLDIITNEQQKRQQQQIVQYTIHWVCRPLCVCVAHYWFQFNSPLLRKRVARVHRHAQYIPARSKQAEKMCLESVLKFENWNIERDGFFGPLLWNGQKHLEKFQQLTEFYALDTLFSLKMFCSY